MSATSVVRDAFDSLANGSSEAAPAAAPFAVLDFLIPGFSTISSFVKTYLGIDLNLYIPILLVIFGSVYSWNYVSEHFWTSVSAYLMSSVTIRTDDEIFDMVMAWVSAQGFSRKSHRFMANTKLKSFRRYYYDPYEDENNDRETDQKPLQYTPNFGSHFFWYKGRILKFHRNENKDGGAASFYSDSGKQELTIQCFGRNPAILKDLLDASRLLYAKKDENKTLIYRGATSTWSETTWQRCLSRSGRPMSTVIMSEKVKQDLLDDVKDYLNPATRRWYANRGIPYRRGYLFHGPPGTGKSSVSLALAGYFNLRIYMVSLNSPVATEENLTSLFADLPRRCCVLLEDIDSAGLSRTLAEDNQASNATNPADPSKPSALAPAQKETSGTSRLSLSGLLNILDGVASQEGRVLVMTTNHIGKLDKALIRPGRVDMSVEFGFADSDVAASLYRAIYTPYEGEEVPDFEGKSASHDDHERSDSTHQDDLRKYNSRIDKLSREFGSKVPGHEFSPAEIQGLLLKYKKEPNLAIEKLDEWVGETRADKKAKELEEAEKKRKVAEQEKEEKIKKEKEEKEQKEKEEKERKSLEKDEKAKESKGKKGRGRRSRRSSHKRTKVDRKSDMSSSSSGSESSSGESDSDSDSYSEDETADVESKKGKKHSRKTDSRKKEKKQKKSSEAAVSVTEADKVKDEGPAIPLIIETRPDGSLRSAAEEQKTSSEPESVKKGVSTDSGYGSPTEKV